MVGKIFSIITTKDRYNLFEKAIDSILAQTVLPDITIVVSDSENSSKKLNRSCASLRKNQAD